FTGNSLDITPATLTVTANHQTKVYGAGDPALTYSVSGLANNDAATVVTGSLTRAAGEAVGSYAIAQGSLVASGNYTIAFTDNSLDITPATLTVTANHQTKVYGAGDPALTYSVSGLANNDAATVVTGSLTRAAGEAVGSYAIAQGSLVASGNYTIAFTGNSLDITPATLTVTANHQTKVYGAGDPALTYSVSGLANNDAATVVTGSLTRAAGEAVGSYAIAQGSLVASGNYTIAFTDNSLDITPATLTVTANHQTKVYGAGDPALTYSVSGLANNDAATVVTGSLTRAAGEAVGSYAIAQGSLVASGNYTIAFTGNSLDITPATLTVTANHQSKVYGSGDPALTYSVNGLANNDAATVVTGSLTRAAGEAVGSYAIAQGSLVASGNYTIAFTGNSLDITPATLTVTANHQTKVYGTGDPALTYSVSGLANNDAATVVTGSLTRAAGEAVGSYAISQGSLVGSGNYTIAFTGNSLDITPATLTVTANHQTKVYGAGDPALTYSVSGLANNDAA